MKRKDVSSPGFAVGEGPGKRKKIDIYNMALIRGDDFAIAAAENNIEFVMRELLNVSQADPELVSAIFEPMVRNHHTEIAMLMYYNNNETLTSAFYAYQNYFNRWGLDELLSEHGLNSFAATVDMINAGNNFVNLALEYNDAALAARILGDNEIDFKAHNQNGDTVVHLAARVGDVEFIRLLLRQFDLLDVSSELFSAENNNGETPLSILEASGRLDIIALITEATEEDDSSVDDNSSAYSADSESSSIADPNEFTPHAAVVLSVDLPLSSNTTLLGATSDSPFSVAGAMVDFAPSNI